MGGAGEFTKDVGAVLVGDAVKTWVTELSLEGSEPSFELWPELYGFRDAP